MTQPPDSQGLDATLDLLIDRSDNVIRLVSGDGSSLEKLSHMQAMRVDTEEQKAQEEYETAADLVSRIGAQDRSAENELVARYQERLRYVLLRRMTEESDAVEDVLQTTLAKVIVRLREEGIDDPSRLGGFIYGVARNTMLTSHRERRRFQDQVDQDVLDLLKDGAPGPEEVTSVSETTQIVRRLLAEFRSTRGHEKYAEVLIRFYVQQQDRQEICEALDLTPKGFRNALHRAKARLKELVIDAEQRNRLGLVEDE